MKILSWFTFSLLLHLAVGFYLLSSQGPSMASDEVIDLTVVSLASAAGDARPSALIRTRHRSPSQNLTVPAPVPASESPTPSQDATAAVAPSSPYSTELSQEGEAELVSWGEVTRLPRVKKEIKAIYPQTAKSAGIDGAVNLELIVDGQGQVRTVKVLSGPGYGLNESALEALKKFEFQPAWRGQEPVAVKIKYTYRFKLDVN